MSDLPARRLDRGALERVLSRAAELQANAADPSELPDAISEERILELGSEVGLDADHLRQAIAEERTRVALTLEERGISAALLGVGRVRAGRVVAGSPPDVLTSIDRWMQREEGLIVMRHHSDRIVWEPSRDVLTAIRRALSLGGREYPLTRATDVSATVTAVDERRALAVLDVNLAGHRERMGWGSGLATAAGLAWSGMLSVMLLPIMLPVAAIPAIGAAGVSLYAARRTQMRAALRAQLALEQVLDRLERGELPRVGGGILGAITAVAAEVAAPRRR